MKPSINYDYHIHANVLHPESKADAFIERAIELGLGKICITDHAPFPQFKADDRIPTGETRRYCKKVRELADKYRERIEVSCGMEIDYYPNLIPQIEEILAEGDFDYIIGSSHLHIPGLIERPLSEFTADEYVALCFENTLRAVKSGYFNTIAHIDMYRWIVSRPDRFMLRTEEFNLVNHEAIIREVFSEMEKRGVNLEVNTHRMSSGDISKVYPSAELMCIASEYDLSYRFGSDAHTPEHVADGFESVAECESYKPCMKFFKI
ncbi:MAG: histidinol-phosphatase HisJ family protein [Clostridia bacterium]|nr:histidinol-phosphatase HisJ family protein [Clostridia bacterium]